jgi:hypothetical protein
LVCAAAHGQHESTTQLTWIKEAATVRVHGANILLGHYKVEVASSLKMPFRRQRLRRRIALLALLGLLFQQVAMATYICPIEIPATAMAAATAADMPNCPLADTKDQARCAQHCHPILTPSAADSAAATVPLALLPVTTWLRGFEAMHVRGVESSLRGIDARSPAPPLTIQYCTFQI